MKTQDCFATFFVAMLFLAVSGCATTTQPTAAIPAPVATKKSPVEKRVISSPEQPGDRQFLYSQVAEKLKGLSVRSLTAVNNFIDVHLKTADEKDVVVLALDVKQFPFFLEKVMKSNPLLNALPRDRERLVVVESSKVPGVRNVYYRVKAVEVPEGKQHVWNWAPEGAIFKKYIDLKENLIENKSPEEQFMVLFYLGNYQYNHDLVLSMEEKDGSWNWEKMAHPKDTVFQQMIIPIATIKNGGMEVMTLDLKAIEPKK